MGGLEKRMVSGILEWIEVAIGDGMRSGLSYGGGRGDIDQMGRGTYSSVWPL